jgi:hypothetical protein
MNLIYPRPSHVDVPFFVTTETNYIVEYQYVLSVRITIEVYQTIVLQVMVIN